MGDPRYRLVIFDFDGTLADSGDWFLSTVDHLADRFKFRRVSRDEVEALRGKSTRDVIRHLGIPRWKLPAMGRYLHGLLAQQTDRIALFEGIPRVLHALREGGVRLALVTSNAEQNARAILGPHAALFERLECGASLFGKARCYRRVIRQSRVMVSDVLSIGDETRDIQAAHKVGIASGAVLWGYAHPDALVEMRPDLVFATPEQIVQRVLADPSIPYIA
ncbi:HAD hydrolase-like protein [Sphingomonas sp. TREG-RG-20F-R18-01]|uniref:HAD hydrolase-like protein n=1 Tax=Sphingomonas sp. TREG-RG-20F-R18-01 TaxID=2914982 RepID=UPI001F56062D|nr:HAD hydrolase-like protein [Sphingomonas sp. TREG-RG-20F-R18-01]